MRIKKAMANSITSLLYQFILIVSGLIVPRMVLENYGSDCNGVISSATQFMNIVSLLTIGLTAATRIELYKDLAFNDYFRISQVVYTTKMHMHRVAYILGAYVVVLSLLYPNFAHSSLEHTFITKLILAVGIGSFFEYFLGIPYRILLQADQRNYIEYSLSSVSCITYTTISILLIKSHFSLVTVKLSSAMISPVAMVGVCLYANKKYNLKTYKQNKIVDLPLRKDAAIHSVANIIHQNSDLVILTIFMDIKLVSVYTIYYFVIGQIKKLMASFTDGLEAAFGNMWAKHEIETLKERFNQYELIVYILIAIIFSCTAVLLIPFVSLYTKGVTDVNYIRPNLCVLFVATELIYCLRQPYATIVQASGKYKETKRIAIIEASVNLSLSIILVQMFGINGAIIGTLAANIIRTLYYIVFSYKEILRSDYKKITVRLFWLFVSFLIVVVFLNMLLSCFEINNWFEWIIWGFISFVVSSGLFFTSAVMIQKKDLIGFVRTIKIVLAHAKYK